MCSPLSRGRGGRGAHLLLGLVIGPLATDLFRDGIAVPTPSKGTSNSKPGMIFPIYLYILLIISSFLFCLWWSSL